MIAKLTQGRVNRQVGSIDWSGQFAGRVKEKEAFNLFYRSALQPVSTATKRHAMPPVIARNLTTCPVMPSFRASKRRKEH